MKVNLYHRAFCLILLLSLLGALQVHAQRVANYQYSRQRIASSTADFSYDVPPLILGFPTWQSMNSSLMSNSNDGSQRYEVTAEGNLSDKNNQQTARLLGYAGERIQGAKRPFLPPHYGYLQQGGTSRTNLTYEHPDNPGKIQTVVWALDSVSGVIRAVLNVYDEASRSYVAQQVAPDLALFTGQGGAHFLCNYVLHTNGKDIWVVMHGKGVNLAGIWKLTENRLEAVGTFDVSGCSNLVFSHNGDKAAYIGGDGLHLLSFNRANGSLTQERTIASNTYSEMCSFDGVFAPLNLNLSADGTAFYGLTGDVNSSMLYATNLIQAQPTPQFVETLYDEVALFSAANGKTYVVRIDSLISFPNQGGNGRCSGWYTISRSTTTGTYVLQRERKANLLTMNFSYVEWVEPYVKGYPHKQRTSAKLHVSTNGLCIAPVAASIGVPAGMDATSFRYTFGDGSAAVTDRDALHFYAPMPGRYKITGTAYNRLGQVVYTESTWITLQNVKTDNNIVSYITGLPTCGADTVYEHLVVKPTQGGFILNSIQGYGGQYGQTYVGDTVVPQKYYGPNLFQPQSQFPGYSWFGSFPFAFQLYNDTSSVAPLAITLGICPGDTQVINLQAYPGVFTTWQGQPVGSAVLVNQPGSYTFGYRRSTVCPIRNYTVVVPMANNCVTEIPNYLKSSSPNNVVTANGDGVNEFLEIPGAGPATLRLYNRWSQCVYQSEKYGNDWPEADVPAGVYYYTASRQGKSYKGWVEVVR